ncbi:MAG: hypothetical protein ACLFT4_07245 [Bacteroidales bacterium]
MLSSIKKYEQQEKYEEGLLNVSLSYKLLETINEARLLCGIS